jgi:branched-chain amino acid aminotransferase
LVKVDKDWFPDLDVSDPGQLYLRMCHISTDEVMGVKTPSATKIFAMLNPTHLKTRNLSLKCSDGANKNWPLGHGQYTLSGNLGALVPYVADAKQNGFDDVLWLLDDYVQEMTILNVFFVYKDRYGKLILSTPLDNGCILPNTIRNSILELSDKIKEDTGLNVMERYISIHEVLNAAAEGRLIEVIGCSTSSFI